MDLWEISLVYVNIIICDNENTEIKVPDYVKVINRKNIRYDFGILLSN